jgi:hypothetical protein
MQLLSGVIIGDDGDDQLCYTDTAAEARIRAGYAPDTNTYPASIHKKQLKKNPILGPTRIRPSWPITGYVLARWQPS